MRRSALYENMKKKLFPSIEEQLHASKVTRGSALEKLIRDNQDFDLLSSQEAHDDAGLPPWLRVYWRKSHPDEQRSTVNPGASYPDVLYTIYTWMLSHQDLSWSKQTRPAASGGKGEGTDGKKGRTR